MALLLLGAWRFGDVARAQQENPLRDQVPPAPKQTPTDDRNLPRYLFIGDSISLNYGKAIVDLHAGKLSVHHPPENCRSSSRGRSRVSTWLGDYRRAGQQWDVISFNFGHWDVTNSKKEYQDDLHEIIKQLKQTDARLVWVTTCPIPDGFDPIDTPASADRAPGRKSGVAKTYLNPWAAEVVADYPEITICDQWQFVHENRNGLYKQWWKGDNVHFSAGPAYGIGRLLAEHILELVGEHRGPGWSKPTADVGSPVFVRSAPAWRPNAYIESKTGDYYSETETANHLPERWKNARRLPAGFPKDFPIALSPEISDHQCWTYDLIEVANHLQLKSIKTDIQNGHRLAWYPLREHDRYRVGPGLTGDELLADLQSGEFPEDISREDFIDGFLQQNVSTLYDLYRITRDRYYSDQIVKYAEAVELILKNRPGQLLVPAPKDPSNPDRLTSGETANAEFLWAHVNAARLLLEQVRVDRGGPFEDRVVTAKRLLKTTNEHLALLVTARYQSPIRVVGQYENPMPFVPGTNTLWLVQDRNVPERAAQMIEYTPWNQTLARLSILTAAVRAMEELQGIEKSNDDEDLIQSYRRTVAAGIEILQRENDCLVRDDVPYFFHAHWPQRDQESESRLAHPMFAGEDITHAAENAYFLAYIWESGETFGCPTALVAGYANAMIDLLEHPTGEKANLIYPRSNLASPWFIAATGHHGTAALQLGERFIAIAPFAPGILGSHRKWHLRKEKNEDLQYLRAAIYYRTWQRRKMRSGK